MKGLLVSAVFVGVLGQLVGCTGDEDLTFNRAMELYKPDTLDVIQLHEARDLLAALDDANHPEGEYMLAMMYQRGDGVPADQDKALKLFLESSNHGNGDASAVASTFFDYGVWGAMEPKTNVSSESHRKGAFRSPAHPPGITL